jgi:hypothetical protein
MTAFDLTVFAAAWVAANLVAYALFYVGGGNDD